MLCFVKWQNEEAEVNAEVEDKKTQQSEHLEQLLNNVKGKLHSQQG